MLIPALAACSHADPQVVPAPPSSAVAVPGPVAGRFTDLPPPCPAVRDQPGVLESTDLYISTTIRCSYGGRDTFPSFFSTILINKPLASQGSPDSAAERQFRTSRDLARTNPADGIFVEDRAGLGDESFMEVSYRGNFTRLRIRSANVWIEAGAKVDGDGDRAREIAALRALEPQVTELAEALLAQLK